MLERRARFDTLTYKGIKKRALIFLHYNQESRLSDHILYLLSQVRPLYEEITFISNSALDKRNRNLMENIVNNLIVRDNKGYDFGGWRAAIDHLGFEHLCGFDSLTIMNDTCFGPIYSLEEYFEQFEVQDIDFWGNTNHRKISIVENGENFTFEEHIQSYFITFNVNVVRSSVFQEFWANVEDQDEVIEVINLYETQLTRVLMDSGFKYKTLIDTTDTNIYKGHPNLCHTDAYYMLKFKSPFVKVKNFVEQFHNSRELMREIESKSNYPVSLIEEHLEKTCNFTIPEAEALSIEPASATPVTIMSRPPLSFLLKIIRCIANR